MSKSFTSKLTDEIAKLSHKKQFKTVDEAVDYLRSQGVKDAEMEYSGIRDQLGVYDKTGMGVSPTALGIADGKRPDEFRFDDKRIFEFKTHELPEGQTLDDYAGEFGKSEYEPYTLPGGDNYREFLYGFSNDPSQRNPDDITKTRSYSHHFQDIPNYLGHVRSKDEIWDGEPVLNVNEVQSDVLGHSLRPGSLDQSIEFGNHMSPENVRRLDEIANDLPVAPTPGGVTSPVWDSYYAENIDELNDLLQDVDVDIDAIDPFYLDEFLKYGEVPAQSGYMNVDAGPGPNRFPNTKNYRERMLERAMDVAQNEGKTKLVVPLEDLPIKGSIPLTPEGEKKVTRFYAKFEQLVEDQNVPAEEAWLQVAKDPAQQRSIRQATGRDLSTMTDQELLDLMGQGIDNVAPPGPIAGNLHRGDHIQKQEYDLKKGRVPKALKKIARDQGMEYSTIQRNNVEYGVLDFKGKKKKPTELYGLGGMFSLGTLNQLMQDPPPDA